MRYIIGFGMTIIVVTWLIANRSVMEITTEPEVELQIDTSRIVQFRLPSGLVASGRLDEHGTFIRHPLGSTSQSGWDGAQCTNDPHTYPDQKVWLVREVVYEFRSGSLIEGELKYPGVFIPTPGIKILSVNDFTPHEGAPRIYNLPGRFVATPAGQKRKLYEPPKFNRGGPPFPPPPPYRWNMTPTKPVAFLQDGKVYAGVLNTTGRFVENRDIPGVPDIGQKELEVATKDGKRVVLAVINRPREKDEYVIEYRHGRYLGGFLHADGTFRPQMGGTVAEDPFHPNEDPFRFRIYNLPGEIVKRAAP